MKRYVGRRNATAADVTVDGVPLNPRRDLWNHSPSGFEWGYAGSGPAQLALALLADCLGDEDEALEWYHDFKSAVVAGLPYAGWTLSEEEIRDTVAAFETA
jgi:hypothetical protein